MLSPCPASSTYPLILFSGMGADERLFQLQAPSFPNLVVPAWQSPHRRETLPRYAARMAETLAIDQPCFVGGASFGGMVALEVARHLPTKACFLISTVRSRCELPWRYRCLTPLATMMPGLCVHLSQHFARVALAMRERLLGRKLLSPLRVISEAESDFYRWAGVAALRWKPSSRPLPFPIFQIHGDQDPVFDVRHSRAEAIVPGGGHLLPLTHPQIIREFLKTGMEQVLEGP